jgi:hypothetical protein
MALRHGLVDQVLVVRWEGRIEVTDLTKVIEVAASVRRTLGRPVILLSIIPADSVEMPDTRLRETMQRLMPRLEAECEAFDTVIEGSGLRVNLLRTVVRGLMMVTKQRGRTFVHDSVDAAVRRTQQGTAASATLRFVYDGGFAAPVTDGATAAR